ncbi:sensor histidine kinase [Desulfitobacterium chlororespirans]|uniref:histidine kinase n=1 Tax=Desulfitobacterium chlororespirans DSM 11544 TaxID=1121395 RepID=A0A1M7TP12_9FIRM|nr:HAMP domain-containing sensor histidine kinase [Desulfitobacterium chlororespirans]SHN72416.1 Signal transduction histidine kinase [Desulfitobacterium chlororespirans DSM 11544]
MHKISLRLRITLLVGLILVLLTTALTIASILSANHYFVMPQLQEATFTPISIEPVEITTLENFQIEHGFDEFVNPPDNMVQMQITTAQRGFSLQSIAVLIVIIVFGLVITYWIMGRALRPLTVLSETIHDINAHNLSKSIAENSAKDEVGSITVSFNGMLDRLKGSFEQQKRFSASAAHELKTPLATMKTSLQVLQLDDSPSLDDYKDAIAVMEHNIERLISIVNDLLLLSSEGKTELNDEISLHTLFGGIVEELKEAIQDKNLCCILPQNDCLITGSSMLLRSAFYNLFENAVKYNKEGGTVEVTFQKTPDGKAAVSICDTGIGMSEEEAERVFEPFFRADRSCIRQIPGNGLGMSIIRTIIERHGGEIQVESKLNMGTKVRVVL